MKNETAMTVYAVFTEGQDFYARPELDSLFSSKEAAEAYAAALRLELDEDGLFEGDLLYASVSVQPWNVQ